MQKSINELKNRRKKAIQILYRLFLLDNNIDKIKQEILDGFQLKSIDENQNEFLFNLLEQIDLLIEIVSNLLENNWNWNRIPKIIQAILINGAYEIKNNITLKAIVINESIELTRQYLPSWDTNFINGLLDKII
ncbi:transcription antitermination factor NusB [Spiroplasma taiwanense]|uniref:Transcription antitermination protein NusB n=1 Tax=Spiroplasma taiwanense CT-1 TaxID=1276220 RepID=S5LZT8_9MOLU|nr:transcription antitermination factor NusB [Spiroplasma taiwanense]AGR41227.1 transcription antitermination protein NusB [Spiroplasma taiwanense CT-1]